MQNSPVPSIRVLRCFEVIEKVKISKTHIYRLINQGKFPKPTKISERISVWNEHEIDAWLAAKFAA